MYLSRVSVNWVCNFFVIQKCESIPSRRERWWYWYFCHYISQTQTAYFSYTIVALFVHFVMVSWNDWYTRITLFQAHYTSLRKKNHHSGQPTRHHVRKHSLTNMFWHEFNSTIQDLNLLALNGWVGVGVYNDRKMHAYSHGYIIFR